MAAWPAACIVCLLPITVHTLIFKTQCVTAVMHVHFLAVPVDTALEATPPPCVGCVCGNQAGAGLPIINTCSSSACAFSRPLLYTRLPTHGAPPCAALCVQWYVSQKRLLCCQACSAAEALQLVCAWWVFAVLCQWGLPFWCCVLCVYDGCGVSTVVACVTIHTVLTTCCAVWSGCIWWVARVIYGSCPSLLCGRRHPLRDACVALHTVHPLYASKPARPG